MHFLNLLWLLSHANSQKCLTLSYEGGGSHGAYEAGAIYTMVNTLKASDVAYTVISGISTGALNTAGSVQYPVGQEVAMADYLVNIWLSITGNDDIYVQWPGGYAQAILFEPSLYDTRPLRNFLAKYTTKGINRVFSVGATSLNTGNFKNYDESIGNANLNNAVLSSAAPPFLFPYVLFQGDVMADGGCLINLDVFAAVEKCLNLGYTQSNIVVDLLFDEKISSVPVTYTFNTIEVFSRVRQIQGYNSAMWYYNEAKIAYPQVSYRYVVIPSQDMPGGYVPLNFTPSVLLSEVNLGKSDAAKVVKAGPNGWDVLSKAFEEVKNNIVIP